MAGTEPYIGSTISLISKAEIRYEGTLYGIDPTESTVTLSKGECCAWEWKAIHGLNGCLDGFL